MINLKYIKICLVSSILLGGCASNTDVQPKNLANNVDQHIVSGLKLLQKGDIEDAKQNFISAKQLDHRASSVYSSLALVELNKIDLFDKSKKYINTPLDEFRYDLAQIRTTNNKDVVETFYNKVQNIKVKFLPYYHDKGSADYYTGKFYYKILDLKKANIYFENTISKYQNSKFKYEAKKLWSKTNTILQAMGLSKWSVTTKKIALLDQVKRVDAAVVLADELNLNKLLKTAFVKEQKNMLRKTPVDVINHPNLSDLKVIFKYGLRGLEPMVYDGKLEFLPNKMITRGEFALVLEDIISKVKHDSKMKRKFIGSVSPFSDLKNNNVIFNAAMTSISMGFLNATKYNEFRPNEPLSGAELIQAIAKIKEEIAI